MQRETLKNIKKLLVITGDYWPLPSANGLCLDAILKELFKRGYFAHVVSFNKRNELLRFDYCDVHNIATNNTYKRSKNILTNIKNFIKIFLTNPLYKKKDMNAVIDCAKEILNNENISCILCVQRPAASGYVGTTLKKAFPRIPLFLYEMDSLTDNGSNYVGWERIFKYRNKRLEKKIFKNTDKIFYLKSHDNYYKSKRYARFSSKMYCIDTPLLDKSLFDLSNQVVKKDRELFRFIYSGVLTMECRSPVASIEFIKELNKVAKAEYSFYVRGNALDYLKKESSNFPGLIDVTDYIPRNELDLKITASDYLVSIGENFNDKAFSFPSKIIYYMSFGKPIIHFAYDENDLCIDYLNKYPLSLVLIMSDDVSKNVERFLQFVKNTQGISIDFNQIENTFFMNSPKYTVDLFFDARKE